MKFIIIHDGLDSTIKSCPDDTPGAYDVLGHAKTALSTELRTTRNKYNQVIRTVEAINLKTVEPLTPVAPEPQEPIAA